MPLPWLGSGDLPARQGGNSLHFNLLVVYQLVPERLLELALHILKNVGLERESGEPGSDSGEEVLVSNFFLKINVLLGQGLLLCRIERPVCLVESQLFSFEGFSD